MKGSDFMKKLKICTIALFILLSLVLLLGCAKYAESFDVTYITSGGVGQLSCMIKITGNSESYEIYFAKENKEALEGYAPLTTVEMENGEGRVSISNAPIPKEARGLVALGGENSSFSPLPEDILILSEKSYSFGALSDVHYSRYTTDGEDTAIKAFDNALDYFESVGVDFVGIAGDITRDGEESSLNSYNEAISKRPYPVYTVTGNHDVPAIKSGLWQEKMNLDALKNSSETTSIGKNGLDFVYKPSKMAGDVFVFLNQVRWEYNKEDSSILDMEQLTWLREVLEANKNETVYLFFHTFLCGEDGEKHTGVGNFKNPGGYTYDLPYTYGCDDEVEFRSILKEYKNVVWFSGHSHWMIEMAIYSHIANYSCFDGEYCHMVHVPSVTEPRFIGENDTSRTGMHGKSSQGWLIEAYDDILLLTPVELTTSTRLTQYMEIIYTE